MPFDCMPMIDNPKPLGARGHAQFALTTNPIEPSLDKVSPISAWHPNRGPENVDSTIAVLVRARALIADERHWSRGAFARSMANIPVRPHSFFACRFCAIGALKRAACELLLPTLNAYIALKWQTGRRVEGWNDDPPRAHADVIAAFDAAILALRQIGV